ncbi:MAG TPA: long-chain-fatty-acid--CoA ligase [Acidimicrobiales bacterium]|nr:long-chain-fatty-acid--CoA ligase [Acidimicrobiales bacterium]
MKELVYHRQLLPTAERTPDKVASVDGSFQATYGEHVERVLRLAGGLGAQLGVGRADRFAVMALNGHEFLELYHAAFLGAGVINPLNLRLAPQELAFILRDSGTRVIFVDRFFAPLIDRVRAETSLEHVVLIGGDGADVPHDAAYEDVLDAGDPVLPAEPGEHDVAVLMYTGGTTGVPKGVVVEQRALVLDLYKIATIWGIDESFVYLHQTPMFHAASLGGVLGIPAAGGVTTYLPMFDPGPLLDVIEQTGTTITVMVPTMIAMTFDHPAFRPERLASLKVLTYGASPMPAALLDRLLGMFPDVDVYQGYGMTESCGLLTALGPEEHRRGGDVLRSAGRPVPGAVVVIQDPEGNELPTGETGEVCARSGNYMREYWNRPDETAEVFRGGWYHTGDAGYVDGGGYVYLVDRVKDMIVTGGENVYSTEVENALSSHPAVAEIAVIGIPSERWGEAVHAVVVLKPGAQADEAELQAWCRERIAGYKVPKSFEFRTEPLPLSGALKVLKRDLRAPYWEGRERTVN